MIFLTTTSDVVRVSLTQSISTDITTGWVIHANTGSTPASFQTNIAAAGTSTIVTAPIVSTENQVKFISIKNRHGVTNQIATLEKYDGVNAFELIASVPLLPDETLIYIDSIGFKILDNNGVEKSNAFGGGGADELVKISANDTTSGFLNGKLLAGTSISLTENNDGGNETLTIANTSPNIDQDLWETISSDAGSVAANTTTDTLTLAGGTGLSTAVSGDTVTFTNDSPNVDQNLFLNVLSDSGTATADTTTDTLSILGGTGISTAVVLDALTITNDSPNATHTGQVTGATALALDVTAVTAQPPSGAIVASDTIIINDGGVLSEATFTQMDTYFNSSLSHPVAITTIGGQDIVTYTDSTRTKTLSVETITLTWSEAAIGNNDWVEVGRASDADSSHIVSLNGTIVGFQAHCENDNNTAKDIILWLDTTDMGAIATFGGTGNNSIINDNTVDIDVTAGQRIRLRGGGLGGLIQDTVITLKVKWRA